MYMEYTSLHLEPAAGTTCNLKKKSSFDLILYYKLIGDQL